MKVSARPDNRSPVCRQFPASPKSLRFLQISLSPLKFDFSPVIRRLKNHFAVGRGFQFDNHKPPVFPQSEQINFVAFGAKLLIKRRQDQICVQKFDISPQNGFEPRFGREFVKSVAFIRRIKTSINFPDFQSIRVNSSNYFPIKIRLSLFDAEPTFSSVKTFRTRANGRPENRKVSPFFLKIASISSGANSIIFCAVSLDFEVFGEFDFARFSAPKIRNFQTRQIF